MSLSCAIVRASPASSCLLRKLGKPCVWTRGGPSGTLERVRPTIDLGREQDGQVDRHAIPADREARAAGAGPQAKVLARRASLVTALAF